MPGGRQEKVVTLEREVMLVEGGCHPACQKRPDSAVIVVEWLEVLAFDGNASHPPIRGQFG